MMEFCAVCGNPHATCICLEEPEMNATIETNLAQCVAIADGLIQRATDDMKFAERLSHDIESITKEELLWLQEKLTYYYVPLDWRNTMKNWIDRLDGKNSPLKVQQQIVLLVFFTKLLEKIEAASVCKLCGRPILSEKQNCEVGGPDPNINYLCSAVTKFNWASETAPNKK